MAVKAEELFVGAIICDPGDNNDKTYYFTITHLTEKKLYGYWHKGDNKSINQYWKDNEINVFDDWVYENAYIINPHPILEELLKALSAE